MAYEIEPDSSTLLRDILRQGDGKLSPALMDMLGRLGVKFNYSPMDLNSREGRGNRFNSEEFLAANQEALRAAEGLGSNVRVVGRNSINEAGRPVLNIEIVGDDGQILAAEAQEYKEESMFWDKLFPTMVKGFLGTAFAGGFGFGPMAPSSAGAASGAATGAGAGAGTAAPAVEGAFTLPVSPGGVGPASSWASLGEIAAGGGAAGTGLSTSALTSAAPSAAVAAPSAAVAAPISGAVNPALIESAAGMAGYGTSSAGLGGAPGVLTGVGATVGGGGNPIVSGINSLFGTELTGSQMGSIAGGIGQVAGAIKGFGDADDLKALGQGADAFQPYRAGYAKMLSDLMADPSSVTSLPGFEFGLKQSEEALTRNLAAQGLTGSGTAAKAIPFNASDYAGKFYQQQIQTLAGLSGAGMNNVGTGIAAQTSAINAENNSLNNLFKLIPMIFGGK